MSSSCFSFHRHFKREGRYFSYIVLFVALEEAKNYAFIINCTFINLHVRDFQATQNM